MVYIRKDKPLSLNIYIYIYYLYIYCQCVDNLLEENGDESTVQRKCINRLIGAVVQKEPHASRQKIILSTSKCIESASRQYITILQFCKKVLSRIFAF